MTLDLSKVEMAALLGDLGVVHLDPSREWVGVLGLLEVSGGSPALGVARPLPSPGPVREEGVALLPLAWGLHYLRERNPDAMFMDGPYMDCFVGIWSRIGDPPLPVYDRSKVVHRLAVDYAVSQGDASLDYGQAVEHFESDIGSAYIGEGTPAFLTRYVD